MSSNKYLGELHVEQILKLVGLGATKPLFCTLSNESAKFAAVVKTRNNESSNATLINEFFGYKISERLELPIPEYGICEIDKNSVLPDDLLLEEEHFGLGFFSKRIENAFVLNHPMHLMTLTNKDEFLKVICLDYLLANKDRNPGNILADTKNKQRLHGVPDRNPYNHPGGRNRSTLDKGPKRTRVDV